MGYILIYDSDCGPCTRFKRAVAFLDTRNRISFIGLDAADSSGLLAPIPQARRHRSFHLISPSGRVWSGAEALSPLTSLLPGGAGLSFVMGRNPLAFNCASFVYGVFSRLHDVGSCSYASRGRALQSGNQIDTLARGNSHLSL
jgi:predicted DCC family thiol-disulfide oxidoreductase YuxK